MPKLFTNLSFYFKELEKIDSIGSDKQKSSEPSTSQREGDNISITDEDLASMEIVDEDGDEEGDKEADDEGDEEDEDDEENDEDDEEALMANNGKGDGKVDEINNDGEESDPGRCLFD